MKNASFHDEWTDFVFAEHPDFMNIQRQYNSRSLHDGIFGFGWCSFLETKIEIQENSIQLHECHRSTLFEKEVSLINKFTSQMTFKNKIDQRQIFYKDEVYTYSTPQKTLQFNQSGQLIFVQNSKNQQFVIKYNGYKIQKVMDSHGHMMLFYFDEVHQKVSKVSDLSEQIQSHYFYSKGNLTAVKNAWGNHYQMEYDDLHNLTKVHYPDSTTKEIVYDTETDRVMAFTHRTGCVENYQYQVVRSLASEKLISRATKSCEDKVTNSSTYEFTYQNSSQQRKHLSQIRKVSSIDEHRVVYSPKTGQPMSFFRGSHQVHFEYDSQGRVQRLKSSFLPQLTMKYFKERRLPAKVRIGKVWTDLKYDSKNKIKLKSSNDYQSLVTALEKLRLFLGDHFPLFM